MTPRLTTKRALDLIANVGNEEVQFARVIAQLVASTVPDRIKAHKHRLNHWRRWTKDPDPIWVRACQDKDCDFEPTMTVPTGKGPHYEASRKGHVNYGQLEAPTVIKKPKGEGARSIAALRQAFGKDPCPAHAKECPIPKAGRPRPCQWGHTSIEFADECDACALIVVKAIGTRRFAQRYHHQEERT